MAESYDIYLTDPLSPAFKVKAFTSNGNIFPTSSSTLNVSTDTSLLIHGKGQPNYGERMAENIIHVLENFSGSTEPVHPISGQLWYSRYNVIRTSGTDFWLWSDSTELWAPITVGIANPNPTLAPNVNDGAYNLRVADLFIAVTDTTHPLAVNWVTRLFEDRTGIDPNADGLLPRKSLKVYTGSGWKNANSVHVSDVEPAAPIVGDIWYDTVGVQLKIHNGASFVSVADRYLLLDGTAVMSGTLDMATNLISNVADPVDPQDAATRAWVLTLTGAAPSTLDGLTDVTILTPGAGEVLKYVGPNWENVALALTDFGMSALLTTTELDTLIGSDTGTTVQNQLDAKLDLAGVSTMTGSLDMGTNQISNVVNPTLPQDAATMNYADSKLDLAGVNPMTGSLKMGTNQINDVVDPSLAQDAATMNYVDTEIAAISIPDNIIDSGTFNSSTLDLTLVPLYGTADDVIVNLAHVHGSIDITHTAAKYYIRDKLPGSYPTVVTSDVIETITQDIPNRLAIQENFAKREVFVAGAADTEFAFTDASYYAGSNRLAVHVNGIKQYATERARQSIKFNEGRNLSPTALLGLAATAYDLDIAIDGLAATTITFTITTSSTIADMVTQINTQIIGAGTCAWNYADTAIHVFSSTIGTGSSVDIIEGTTTDILAALSAVTPGDEFPVLTYSSGTPTDTLSPAYPSNVTDITAILGYSEVIFAPTPGYQDVDVGGAVTGVTATGLLNDATIYTATIAIDGEAAQPISIVGSLAQDYDTLLAEISLDLSSSIISLVGGNLRVTSDLFGATSSVLIADTDLFSSLTAYVAINAAVAGTNPLVAAPFGTEATYIKFTTAVPTGAVVEMISESPTNLLN